MIVCEEQPAFTVDEPAPGQAYGVSLLPAAHPVLASAVLARTHACSGSEMSGEICSWPGRAGAVEREAITRVEHITSDYSCCGCGSGPSEPLILSLHSVSLLCEWGMSKRDLDGIVSPSHISSPFPPPFPLASVHTRESARARAGQWLLRASPTSSSAPSAKIYLRPARPMSCGLHSAPCTCAGTAHGKQR